MKWVTRVLAVVFILGLAAASGTGAHAEGLQSSAGQLNMSVAPKVPSSAARCGSIPMLQAGFSLSGLGIQLAQDNVGDWCSQDRYCETGYFCCGSGCCRNGTNCCARDGGCCPGNLPVGCGPKCYAGTADAEADGCSNWEICGAPVR